MGPSSGAKARGIQYCMLPSEKNLAIATQSRQGRSWVEEASGFFSKLSHLHFESVAGSCLASVFRTASLSFPPYPSQHPPSASLEAAWYFRYTSALEEPGKASSAGAGSLLQTCSAHLARGCGDLQQHPLSEDQHSPKRSPELWGLLRCLLEREGFPSDKISLADFPAAPLLSRTLAAVWISTSDTAA